MIIFLSIFFGLMYLLMKITKESFLWNIPMKNKMIDDYFSKISNFIVR